MFQPRFHVFEAIRFFPDEFELVDFYVPPLQQANRLFIASVSVRVRAFRFGVEFVFFDYFAVRFHPRRISVARMAPCSDSVRFPRVFINPIFLQPVFWILVVWRN